MAIASFAPVLTNQTKKQCRKIAQFTDAFCITDIYYLFKNLTLYGKHYKLEDRI
jgi:hypothetical protein